MTEPNLPPNWGRIEPFDFTSKMQVLVAAGLSAAEQGGERAERFAEMIERLTNALALTCAVACKGNAQATNDMVEGIAGHLFERVTDHAPLALLLSATR